ncbi:hypothetical protein [Tropicimonas marinistellae]|uniref:hypothetical protein n=1 Tax=Tropicimonas marinistellae TaxID=1739787 RepID=UPI00122E7BA0|nr:hypothetical protein [Tropicimonas marinistellae]
MPRRKHKPKHKPEIHVADAYASADAFSFHGNTFTYTDAWTLTTDWSSSSGSMASSMSGDVGP